MAEATFDIIDQHLIGLMEGDESAWNACLSAMVTCAESAVWVKFPGLFGPLVVKDLADEALYEFCGRIEDNRKKLTSARKIRAYLKGIVRNLAYNKLREGRSKKTEAVPTSETRVNAPFERSDICLENVDPEDEDPNPNPSEQAETEEMHELLRQVLLQMPSPCKEIITQWIYEEARGRELGERHGFAARNASTIVARCLDKMRALCLKAGLADYLPKGVKK